MVDKAIFEWPEGKRGAVSVTYDDGLSCHHEVVGPAWERHGLRVTFYPSFVWPNTDIMDNPDAWRQLAANGHELGNHSLFHACRRDGATTYNLKDYTAPRWKEEMQVANFALSLLDGRTERTFGNTCCNTTIGPDSQKESLEPLVAELFVAARGDMTKEPVDVKTVNYNGLGTFAADTEMLGVKHEEHSVEATIRIITEAADSGRWAIFMIHGVGQGTHGFFMEEEEHDELVQHLAERRDEIWTAPVVEVARYLKTGAVA
ncbi:MAG: polysaccharide deacetylase family protein [Candidatus Latescibacteria bacterium]|nr:polysaccharide deacetylase family protein [Candidatus Latescibacterota bacterium]